MKYYPLFLGFPLLLAACGPAQETGTQMANDLKDNVYNTSAKIKEWAATPPPKPAPLPVASTYCYHALQDILCYRQPMPGWEDRLVAYQGTDAKPPPPAMMQPLPVHDIDVSELPVTRVASVKPVFATPPAESKDTDKAADAVPDVPAAVPVTDAAHEQLPDPALAPQL